MTNEEKAKELANKWSTSGAYNRVKISAMEMADWKDQQFKEYLEKKVSQTIEDQKVAIDAGDFKTSIYLAERRATYNEIIRELFSK